jgi:hypothetical protein
MIKCFVSNIKRCGLIGRLERPSNGMEEDVPEEQAEEGTNNTTFTVEAMEKYF